MELKVSLIFTCIYVIHGQDTCTNHIQLVDPTRSVDYTLGSSETDRCDRLITVAWYRFQNNANIPTECQPVLRCGSTGPIWINGSLPVANAEVTLTVCQVGFLGCCESNWQIRVRNCGAFNVFRLTPTPACPGRYCIEGPPAPCKPGWGSESGLEPCKPTNITFVVTPYVYPYIPTYDPYSDKNALAFECKASMPSAYRNYIFDIRWFFDGTDVGAYNTLGYFSLKENGTLYRRDWDPDRYNTLGIRVSCAIRARAFIGAPPTEYSSSKEFYAGATFLATSIAVQSGQSAVINIRSTVPIACRNISGTLHCTCRIELLSFTHQFGDGQKYCNQSLTDKKNPSACGLDFDGFKWNRYQQVLVTALADPTSRPSYSAVVKLRAICADNLWRDYFLPDITVNVFSIRRPTGSCSSYTDPSIRTVDGRYFTSLATGEFVLYKVKDKPIEVHTIQSKAGVNCAVAVRAASDVFIVYGCDKKGKWVVRRLNCDEQNDYLKVYERSLGQMFEIFLPTGTRVAIQIRRNSYNSWLNIHIQSSVTDWSLTEGKCGTYNGNRNDDLTDRNGKIVGVTDFIKSWGVAQSESLFIAKIRNEILLTPFFYCSCNKNASNGEVIPNADCSWEETLPSCQPLNWGQKNCQIQRKRETEDDLEIDVPEEMVTFEESTLSTDWKNGWNETIARQRCESALERSPIYKECSSLQNVENENTIDSCITDIRVSGSDIFLNDVRERMKSECISELRYNVSLWNNDTETSEPSLIDAVYDNDCPNDCSSAGNCTKGICVCQTSYTGDDCSVRTDRPPILYNVSEESLCDLTKRPCSSTSVFGEGFFASDNIKCKIKQAKLTGSTIIEGNVIEIETGNLENFGEVKCPTAGILNRRKRSTIKDSDPDVILVSVSMDGSTFSSFVPVVKFNSSCSSCVISGNSVTCDIRSDICIKDGECFNKSNGNCALSKISPVQQPNASVYLIIGIVVVSVFLLAITVVVIVKLYHYKRYFVKKVNEPSFSMSLAVVNGSAPVSHRAT